MDIGSSLSVVQTILAALQCSELREFCLIWGYKSQLEDLQRTVNTVKAVLNDAQSKRVQPNLLCQAQLYIEELKDVVYDADDLLDEFVTLAEQKKLNKPGKFSQKLRSLFSRYNSLAVAYNMSGAVKDIRKRLDAIANNHSNFGFKFDGQPIRRRREETCSYVYTQDIIGRAHDVEMILDRLLDPDVQRDVASVARLSSPVMELVSLLLFSK